MNNLSGVLIIAYHFPPMGGVGVQRTLKFVKYLPEYGWQPHVLSVREKNNLQDSSLGKEIPTDLPIIRTPILHLPYQLPWRFRNFITRWFFLVDEQIGWLPFANKIGQRVIAEGKIKSIYSTSAPYTGHLIGRHLHKITHLPWIADFRDPWMGNPFMKFPTTLHRQLNERLERSIFTDADRVILNTEQTRRYYMQKYFALPVEKLITISNGYDQSDFPLNNQERPQNSVFTIVHMGSLYKKSRPGRYFLAALHKGLESGILPSNKIRVHFIGNLDQETQSLVKQFKLKEVVELLGYLPHQQALSELNSADLLLLISYIGRGGELFVPAKLYEYLASRKPILCLTDSGDSAELVVKARAGYISPLTDTGAILEQLVSLYHQWEHGGIKIDPDMGFIRSFERRRQTGQLAAVLDQLAGGNG